MSHKRSIIRDYQEMKAHIRVPPHPSPSFSERDSWPHRRKNCSVQIQNKVCALKMVFF